MDRRLLFLLPLAFGAASAVEAAECTTVRKGPNDYTVSCPGGAGFPRLPPPNAQTGGGLHGEVFVGRGFGKAPTARSDPSFGGQDWARPMPADPRSIPPADRLMEISPTEEWGSPIFPAP